MSEAKTDTSPVEELGGRNSEQTRRRLLGAAVSLMAEGGEEAVSVMEVAQRASVTRGTVYHHFRDRNDLITAAKENLDSLYLDMARAVRPFDRPLGVRAGLAVDDESVVRSLVFGLLEQGAAHPYAHEVLSTFRKMGDAGKLRAGLAPEMTAFVGLSSVLGAGLAVAMGKAQDEKRDLARRYSDTFGQFLFYGGFLLTMRADPSQIGDAELVGLISSMTEGAKVPGPADAVAVGDPQTGSKRAEKTHRKIIEAAIELYSKGGTDAVSMMEVAARAAVTRGTVYHHFSDRDALISEVKKELAGQFSGLSALDFFLDGPWSDFIAGGEDIVRSQLFEVLEQGPEHPFVAGVIELFRTLATYDRLKEDVDADMMGIIAFSMILGAILAVADCADYDEKKMRADQYMANMRQAMLHGLLDPQAPGGWPGLPENPRD